MAGADDALEGALSEAKSFGLHKGVSKVQGLGCRGLMNS